MRHKIAWCGENFFNFFENGITLGHFLVQEGQLLFPFLQGVMNQLEVQRPGGSPPILPGCGARDFRLNGSLHFTVFLQLFTVGSEAGGVEDRFHEACAGIVEGARCRGKPGQGAEQQKEGAKDEPTCGELTF